MALTPQQIQENHRKKHRVNNDVRLSGYLEDEEVKKAFRQYQKKHGLSVQKAAIECITAFLEG